MNLGFGNQAIELDANQFKPNADAMQFAEAVSHEIEVRRVALGGRKGGQANDLLVGLLREETIHQGHYVNSKCWYEFLTESELIKTCCQSLNISTIQFLEQCMDKLHPPNWDPTCMTTPYSRGSRKRPVLDQHIILLT